MISQRYTDEDGVPHVVKFSGAAFFAALEGDGDDHADLVVRTIPTGEIEDGAIVEVGIVEFDPEA